MTNMTPAYLITLLATLLLACATQGQTVKRCFSYASQDTVITVTIETDGQHVKAKYSLECNAGKDTREKAGRVSGNTLEFPMLVFSGGKVQQTQKDRWTLGTGTLVIDGITLNEVQC